MPYKLRFVQVFRQNKLPEYLAIERQFEAFEKQYPEVPEGKRYIPCAGRDASNTLIWECDFPTLEALYAAHAFFMRDARHEALLQEQSEYIVRTYTEIYKPFDA